MRIKLFFLGCLVAISTSLWATDAGEFRGETKAKIEILQKLNDELKTKINEIEKDDKGVDEFKNIIDRQDKRIEDVNAKMANAAEKTSWLAIIVGIWAVVATIASIIFPLIFVPKWKNEAISEARNGASQWLKDNSENIQNEINVFKKRLDSLGDEAENKTNHHTEKLNELEAQADEHLQYLQSQKEKSKQLNDVNLQDNALSQLADQLRTKSQNDYSFEDWNRLAFAADEQQRKEDAIYYWGKAIETGQQSEGNIVKTRINIALTQGELDRFQEELRIYDDTVIRFGETKNEETKVLIAEALLNKGIRLGKMEGRRLDAIESYTDLLNRFKVNTNESIDELIASAMLNKGVELEDYPERVEEAKEIFYDLIRKFKISDNESLNETIILSLVNLFELHIISEEDFEIQYIEQLESLIKNHKNILLQYKMLQTIQNSLKEEQIEKINNIKEEFCDLNFEDWRWNLLENWANNMESGNVKARVIATIQEFKNW